MSNDRIRELEEALERGRVTLARAIAERVDMQAKLANCVDLAHEYRRTRTLDVADAIVAKILSAEDVPDVVVPAHLDPGHGVPAPPEHGKCLD